MEENLEPEEINQLLQNLRITSKRTYEDGNFRGRIAEVLNGFGFHAMNDDRETIWKVLRRAVDTSVCAGRNINLAANENTIPNFEDTKLRLEQLLLAERTPRRNIGNSLDDVLCSPFTQELASQLRSPKGIADRRAEQHLGIKQNAHVDFVTNLIEKQFLIKWNTNVSGEPEEFNFYKFCNVEKLEKTQNPENEQMEGKTKHLKYNPRRAHVMVQLYRFCRTRRRIEYSPEELCPPVYIRSGRGWKKWNSSTKTFTPHASNFTWMNNHVYLYIYSRAGQIQENNFRTHTLYWAVVQDEDFRVGNHLLLNVIGKSQVYVGKAGNGIKERWLTASSSHCKMMKKCLDNVQAMTTYDPSRLEGIQLVDARLLLAKLRGRLETRCALFVMKTYEGKTATRDLDDDERNHINGILPRNNDGIVCMLDKCQYWKPKYMAYGMNYAGPN